MLCEAVKLFVFFHISTKHLNEVRALRQSPRPSVRIDSVLVVLCPSQIASMARCTIVQEVDFCAVVVRHGRAGT